MNTTNPNILIGCVTYPGHAYALKQLVQSIDLFDVEKGTAIDLVFADNSTDNFYSKQLQQLTIRGKHPQVLHDPGEARTRIDKIIDGRNKIREFFLKNKQYTHLFFLDSDVICPKQTITELLKMDHALACGVYLGHVQIPNGEKRIVPIAYGFHKEGKVRQFIMKDIVEKKVVKIASAGLGCVLIRRDVFETAQPIVFRNIGSSTTGGEDVAFYKDTREQGFDLFLNTTIRCDHVVFPEGNENNKFFKLRK